MSNRISLQLNSLKFKLLLSFLFLIAVVVAVTLYTVQSATYKHSTGQLLGHSQTSASVVQDKLNNQANSLLEAINALSNNFSFKQLIATGEEDQESLLAALQNFQRRNNTDIAWVQSAEGKTIAVTPDQNISQLEIDAKQFNNNAIRWLEINGIFYLIKSAPIKFVPKSRNVNGWILMGVRASKLITNELVELTDMQVSLVLLGQRNKIIASTLTEDIAIQLQQQSLNLAQGLHQMTGILNNRLYATSNLGMTESAAVHLILSTVEDKAYLSYNSLLFQLVGILFIAALMALVAAMVFSNGITRPITKLVSAANKIRQGIYVDSFPTSSTTEVTSLSSAIDSMQEGIKKREEEIQFLAYYDPLTQLPNRNQFQNHLQESIEKHPDSQIAVLMMDLDRFKEINDTIGHDAGDHLLREIANRLKAFAYQGVFIARTGGDEFALVLNDTQGQNPEALAENFAGLFTRPFVVDQLSLDVDVSIGVANYPKDAQTAQGLMQCADIALYSSKGKHFSYAIYEPALNKHSVQRLSLMSELRGALVEGQLALYYQPKLSIGEAKIETVECLIRWFHPVHGFIPPDEFIPLAEQTGAIRDVTHWALRTGFEQQKKWRDQGFEIGIAVNISAIDLIDMQLPTYVAELMSEFDTQSSSLTLEVTESAVMSDPDSALKALNTLRRMGITLSIDDFGTGYSSMAQLKKMPVDELKIDKAFVLDLANNEDDQIMVRTLISLAQNLGLKTVAEGVEDCATLRFLEHVNCTKAQGFYLSRPIPNEQFFDWLREFKPEHCMDEKNA